MSDRMDNDRIDQEEQAYDFAADGRYTGIGAELKAERLRCGLDLEEVSQRLRIRVQHLQSIEEGRFGDLPGRIYAIGFVRSYAEFLGADGDVCIRLFKDEVGPDGHSRKLSFPTPPIENRRPGMMTLVVSLLLGALIYGGWYVYSSDNDRLAGAVPEVPERFVEQTGIAQGLGGDTIASANASERPPETQATGEASAATDVIETDEAAPAAGRDLAAPDATETGPADRTAPAAAAQDVTETSESTAAEVPDQTDQADRTEPAQAERAEPARAAPEIEKTVAETPAQADDPRTEAADADAASTAETASDPPAETADVSATDDAATEETRLAALTPPPLPPSAQREGYVPRVYGITNRDARIIIRAVEPAQIIVKQSSGRTLLPHRMMQPGDTYRVPNAKGVILESENIDNLEVFLDGKSMGRAGTLAAPARALALSPEILRSLVR